MVRILAERGADVNRVGGGDAKLSVLHDASRNGHLKVNKHAFYKEILIVVFRPGKKVLNNIVIVPECSTARAISRSGNFVKRTETKSNGLVLSSSVGSS